MNKSTTPAAISLFNSLTITLLGPVAVEKVFLTTKHAKVCAKHTKINH